MNAQTTEGKTPLHFATQQLNLRMCKDLCIKGADRFARDKDGKSPINMLPEGFPSIQNVLKQQGTSLMAVSRQPYSPIEKSNKYLLTFVVLFVFIWLNNIFVIEPVLDVWYFMLSTTLCMSKLGVTFTMMTYKKPGYLQPDPSLRWEEILEKVPSKYLCLQCKVIRTPRSQHCNVCNKCVDRYEAHSFWTSTCVGRENAGLYFAFIFYVWLNVFLLGWIAMASIKITACEIDHCVYAPLCFFCNVVPFHYFICYFDMIVCFGFMVPASYHLWLQCANFCKNETTYERFAKRNRKPFALTKDDSFVWQYDE